MIVKLPFPDASLFPNRKNGKHWGASNAAKTSARDTAWALTKQAMAGFVARDGAIPLSIVFVPPTGHHRDVDNMLAAMKSALDGLAMALGVDDKRFRPLLIDVGPAGKPGAVIVGVGVQIVMTEAI